MNFEACYKIGYVARTHGLKGEVTIALLPDCPDITSLKSLFIQRGTDLVPYFIEGVSVKGDKAYVKFEEIKNIDGASELKGASLYLPKSQRPVLSRGDFYNDEVIGFEVIDGETSLGTITDVEEAGVNRFLVLRHKQRDILVPVSGPFIKGINKSKKKISVDLPEGFLDI